MPCTVIAVYSLHYALGPHDYSVTTDLYFLTPSLCHFFQVCPLIFAVYTLLLYLSLDCSWHVNGWNLFPGSRAASTGCAHHGESAVQKPIPLSRTYFSRALVPPESTPWVCHLWKWSSGASMWSEAVHQVCWFWSPLGGCRPRPATPLFCLGPPGMSHKVISRWPPKIVQSLCLNTSSQ